MWTDKVLVVRSALCCNKWEIKKTLHIGQQLERVMRRRTIGEEFTIRKDIMWQECERSDNDIFQNNSLFQGSSFAYEWVEATGRVESDISAAHSFSGCSLFPPPCLPLPFRQFELPRAVSLNTRRDNVVCTIPVSAGNDVMEREIARV